MISDDSCVFCKIIAGKLPCNKIYEDEDVISFLPLELFSIGHILVIPKKHSKWLWDMDANDYSILKTKTYYLANVLRKAFDTDWVEEVVAGIGVEHAHIHLLPRKKGDGLPIVPIEPLNPLPSREEMIEIAEKIRKFLE